MGWAIQGPPVAHDAERDAWRERRAAARRGIPPPWRSNYLACAAWPASSSWNASSAPASGRAGGAGPAHEHPDKDARNGERCSLGHV